MIANPFLKFLISVRGGHCYYTRPGRQKPAAHHKFAIKLSMCTILSFDIRPSRLHTGELSEPTVQHTLTELNVAPW